MDPLRGWGSRLVQTSEEEGSGNREDSYSDCPCSGGRGWTRVSMKFTVKNHSLGYLPHSKPPQLYHVVTISWTSTLREVCVQPGDSLHAHSVLHSRVRLGKQARGSWEQLVVVEPERPHGVVLPVYLSAHAREPACGGPAREQRVCSTKIAGRHVLRPKIVIVWCENDETTHLGQS